MLRKKIWLGICVLAVLLLCAGYWVYRSATSGPDFYHRALLVDAAASRQLGDQLEDLYLEAHNSAVRQSSWSLSFSDEQVNGWITSTLVRKYPRFQPTRIDNLCTQLDQDRIRIAFRVKKAWIPIVVCVDVVPYVTADSKSIAIRLERIGTGFIPLPKKQATDQITQALNRAKIPIAWTVDQGHPVGLIPAGFEMPDGIDRKCLIQNIEVSNGRLVLSGSAMDST